MAGMVYVIWNNRTSTHSVAKNLRRLFPAKGNSGENKNKIKYYGFFLGRTLTAESLAPEIQSF